MRSIRQVCVYCASSVLSPEKYLLATDQLAEDLVKQGVRVVYGGGSTGLMGRLADRMLALGGEITGIMPNFMKEVEWAHKQVKQFHFVADMHERKKRFLEGTDALIALPGGTGTLEELLEAITWKRLGLYPHPIIILNLDGFYDPLLAQLARCEAEHFMSADHRALWTVVNQPEDILKAAQTAAEWQKPLASARVQ
jgi:uncharacterized protein (TIGR00730 family)